MSKLNFLVYLNAYADSSASNNPQMSNFKWTRELDGLLVQNPTALSFTLAPGESRTLFSGARTLAQDGTTEYTLSLKPLTSNTYVLAAVSGTLPNFRTPRTTGADATTQITVTANGPLLTFTSTAGTPLNLTGAQVGDTVVIGNLFNQANQGAWKILSFTATTLTVDNELGAAEGPITLGANFATQFQVFGALGVQIGDTLKISGGFSQITQGSYQVSAVYANSVEFNALGVLPQEASVLTQAIAIYFETKQLVYLESDQNCSLNINGASAGEIEPWVVGSSTKPGIYMRKSTLFSMSVTNTSTSIANLFMASAD